MLKITLLVISAVFLVSCQKNSFESCVDYYEQKAKERLPSGEQWRTLAELHIDSYCSVHDGS